MTESHSPTLLPLPADHQTLIPARDVPRFTGMAKQTHARWRSAGEGPEFVKLGRRVFYTAGALRTWIEKQTRSNTIDAT
jgi:predicted DNA-binding transcriptional regulator AlpA